MTTETSPAGTSSGYVPTEEDKAETLAALDKATMGNKQMADDFEMVCNAYVTMLGADTFGFVAGVLMRMGAIRSEYVLKAMDAEVAAKATITQAGF